MDADHPIALRLRAARESRVRYGRAYLTIARWGGLSEGDLGKATVAFERGELDAEGLCWTFARCRVISHTPSFSWDGAKLGRILSLVAAASTDPEFSSFEVEAIAATLVAEARDERVRAKKARENLRRSMRSFAGIALDSRQSAMQSVLGRATRDLSFLGTAKIPTLAVDIQRINHFGVLGAKAFDAAQVVPSARFAGGTDLVAKPPTFSAQFAITSGLDQALDLLGKSAVQRFSEQMAPLNFSAMPWAQGFATDWAKQGYFQRVLERVIKPTDWSAPHTALLGSLPDYGSWLKSFTRSLPPNWRELEDKEIDQITALMAQTGLCLAWAPRPEIIREVLNAGDHAGRCSVLEANSSQIIEDIEGVLEGVERDDLAPTVEACREAISTYRDGHPQPAISYATSALTDLVHGFLGAQSFKVVRKIFADVDPRNDVGFADFPLFAVGKAWVRVLDHMKNAGDGFNRNLTSHRIGDHYSEANLLAVLLLLAGLLRELEKVGNRHDARQLEAA
jgi:hypothetical protein